MKHLYLSYTLNSETPFYGNRATVNIERVSSMDNGDPANNTWINMSVHSGTHIDLPFHFYKDGQTIDSYSAEDWIFVSPLFIEFKPENLIINQDLIGILSATLEKNKYDSLIIKTGLCENRSEPNYATHNYGFAPEIAEFIREHFPNIRIIGFDSISVSSFQHRNIGRMSHRSFLNPENPILIIEDMDLRKITKHTMCSKITIAPLRIDYCDGLPVTIIAEIDE